MSEAFVFTYIHTYLTTLPMGFSRSMKRDQRTERNINVKNPNRPEAIIESSREAEPGTTRIKFNEWSEQVLNPTTEHHWTAQRREE